MLNVVLGLIILALIFLLGIPSMFIIPYFLGKKFDRTLQQHNLSIAPGFGFMPPHIYRANVYALSIVIFPNPKKYPQLMRYYKKRFGNFWFKEHASTWDKVQAWYITIMTGIMLLTLFIMVACYVVQHIVSLL